MKIVEFILYMCAIYFSIGLVNNTIAEIIAPPAITGEKNNGRVTLMVIVAILWSILIVFF